MYDVVIIGSGPAGLTAAIYGCRAQMKLLVVEKNYMSGGQIINTSEVDNYPGLPGINGFDMAMKFREHAEGLGAEFAEDEITAIEDRDDCKVLTGLQGTYKAKNVLFAMGASHRLLGVPGESTFTGKGVSYCATCDGAFFRNKTAAVVGGGDVAVEDAIYLARLCAKVYVIHRRDTLRAAKSLQTRLASFDNVEMIWDSQVTAIEGEKRVNSIQVYNRKTEKTTTLALDGIFIAVGTVAQSDLARGLVELDEAGYIKAGEDCRTGRKGFFAAGDVRMKKLRQIITAAADGANAISAIEEELEAV